MDVRYTATGSIVSYHLAIEYGSKGSIAEIPLTQSFKDQSIKKSLSKPSIHKITVPNPPNSNLLLQLLRLIHPMRILHVRDFKEPIRVRATDPQDGPDAFAVLLLALEADGLFFACLFVLPPVIGRVSFKESQDLESSRGYLGCLHQVSGHVGCGPGGGHAGEDCH